MRLLLLGGTHEAKALARSLHAQGIDLVYSIAGLVRHPDLPCQVISGGFSRSGGLEAYLHEAGIDQVLDATHPYAANISRRAAEASAAAGVPCWRYVRPAWQAQAGDNWHEFDDWRDLALALVDHRSVFFASGRLDQDFVNSLYLNVDQKQWYRSASTPVFELPPSMTWIEGIGPFPIEAERELMRRHAIDAVVSKNSGGDLASAKLTVARERGIPVYLLKRKPLPQVEREFDHVDDCRDAVLTWFKSRERYAD